MVVDQPKSLEAESISVTVNVRSHSSRRDSTSEAGETEAQPDSYILNTSPPVVNYAETRMPRRLHSSDKHTHNDAKGTTCTVTVKVNDLQVAPINLQHKRDV